MSWADTSTLNFTAKCNGSGTADDGASWTVTSDGTESNFDSTSGIHYGTNNASVTYVQLSTSSISGTISQVVVNARDAQATATVSVTVGGNAFTCSGSTTATNSSADYTFTGSGSGAVVVRVDRGSSMKKAIYVKSVVVTYTSGGIPTCATPTFSPGTGVYSSTQSVTLSCETDGATIYYTTNGTDPTTSSSTYSSAISVSSTTTIKAMATATGYNNSSIASATYTFVEHAGTEEDPYTVADARTAIDAGTGVTGVYATGIVSAIVTAYNSNYSNITFDISSDGSTGSAQLRAYRCVGATGVDASDVQVGDIVKISGDLTNYNGTYEFTQGCELVSLEHPVVTTPTITVGTSALSGFTYEEENGPSDAQTFTVSGSNLTANITLSLGGSNYEMCQTENGTYTSSLTLTQNEGTVSETTVYVRLKSGLAINNYNDNVTLSSTDATEKTVSLSGSVTAPAGPNVAWDLTTNAYSSSSTSEVSWTSSQATMTLAKGSSGTNANNYLGGSGSYTHTRFYQNQVLTIAPASGYRIVSAEITAVANYVAGFTGNAWTNATTSTSGTTVTVTPTDGTQAMSVTISGACRATAVTVYYATNATPSIAVNTTLNVTSDEADGTIDVTYNNIADNSTAQVILCDSEGNTTTYDWIDVELDSNKDVYYVIAANTGAARTGYLKVKVGDVTSAIVTITQGKYTVYNHYTKVTSITSGKHYVIANADGTKAMAGKNTTKDYYDAESVTVDNNTMSVDSETAVQEFVIYGPDASGFYSIYDPVADGYLYASSSDDNYLSVQTTNDENGLWAIDFENETVTAQGSNTHNLLRYNSGSPRFSCYQSGQTAVAFYEKSGEATPTESKTVNAKGYATYCSQNALDFTNATGGTAWAVTGISGTTITFAQITGAVPAGTGMLLMGEANATITIPCATGAAALATNLLEGITTATDVAADTYYGLSGDEFVKVNAGTVPAGKALLPAGLVSSARTLSMVFEGVDGINEIVNGKSVNGTCYDLSGRRVVKPTKGLYIVNGKKVVK